MKNIFSNNEPKTREETPYIIESLSSPDESIVIFDKKFNYVFVNDYGLKILNKSKNNVIGKNVWELLPHLEGSLYKSSAIRAMKSNKASELTEYYPHRNEYFKTRFIPTNDYLLCIIENVTVYMENKIDLEKLLGDLHSAMEVYWSDANKSNRENRKLKQHRTIQINK